MTKERVCPKCGGKEFALTGQKGYSAGKGLAGGIAFGPLGLLFGRAGANKPMMACTTCGRSFVLGSDRDPITMNPDAEVDTGAIRVLVVFLIIVGLLIAGGNGWL